MFPFIIHMLVHLTVSHIALRLIFHFPRFSNYISVGLYSSLLLFSFFFPQLKCMIPSIEFLFGLYFSTPEFPFALFIAFIPLLVFSGEHCCHTCSFNSLNMFICLASAGDWLEVLPKLFELMRLLLFADNLRVA